MKNLSARFYIHLFNFIKMNETLRNNNLYYYFIRYLDLKIHNIIIAFTTCLILGKISATPLSHIYIFIVV
jgi:hypothetical protein